MKISELISELEHMKNEHGDIQVLVSHEWLSNVSVVYYPLSEFTWGIHGETDVCISHIAIEPTDSEGIQSRYNKEGYPK